MRGKGTKKNRAKEILLEKAQNSPHPILNANKAIARILNFF
jgi:hypothetical protein